MASPDASDPRAWRALETEDGSWTLVHPGHGEACHSSSGAWLEALERYARPCRLRERASAQECVRVLEVGSGSGLDLAAALCEVEGAGARLEAVGLELEPAVVRRALELPAGAPGAAWEPWWGQVRAALSQALARPPGERVALGHRSTLRLLLGDARATLAELEGEPLHDAVFLDAFSPAHAPDLWGAAFLARLARRLAPGGWLSTYCAASEVRIALYEAGLNVGLGARVGNKREGTLASPEGTPPPLEARIQRRLERRARAPGGTDSVPGAWGAGRSRH